MKSSICQAIAIIASDLNIVDLVNSHHPGFGDFVTACYDLTTMNAKSILTLFSDDSELDNYDIAVQILSSIC